MSLCEVRRVVKVGVVAEGGGWLLLMSGIELDCDDGGEVDVNVDANVVVEVDVDVAVDIDVDVDIEVDVVICIIVAAVVHVVPTVEVAVGTELEAGAPKSTP